VEHDGASSEGTPAAVECLLFAAPFWLRRANVYDG
jgi:hypothetical protein